MLVFPYLGYQGSASDDSYTITPNSRYHPDMADRGDKIRNRALQSVIYYNRPVKCEVSHLDVLVILITEVCS